MRVAPEEILCDSARGLEHSTLREELAAFVSTLQVEMLQRDTKIDSMQETIVNLANENALLKRRLFGNKTERLHTSENIRAIYAADDPFKKLPPAKRKVAREKHVRPLIDAFFEWVRQVRLTQEGRNLATKALGYAVNQEQELRRVLVDGRLPLDNTRAERMGPGQFISQWRAPCRPSTASLAGGFCGGAWESFSGSDVALHSWSGSMLTWSAVARRVERHSGSALGARGIGCPRCSRQTGAFLLLRLRLARNENEIWFGDALAQPT